jgi:uncharacterized protein YdeI (YjbR/CyaY-like superfamily)
MSSETSDLPVLHFETQSDWERWLEDNTNAGGVWLKIAKQRAGAASISYGEALETALCYGWIDSQMKRLDDMFYVQKFSPRRVKSVWSRVNRDKATELIQRRKMKPTGLKQVELAKADGRWDAAYESQSREGD